MSQGRITIVDDDRDTRQMLALALELEGYAVTEAQSGLRLISSLHVDRPDVILMEAALSWIDGIELCRAVKKNPAFRDVPVVFISVRRRSEDVAAGLQAGAVDYLPKPLHLPRLLARIREILASRRSEEAEA
jgi:DNA-binding response OmpR family regulator